MLARTAFVIVATLVALAGLSGPAGSQPAPPPPPAATDDDDTNVPALSPELAAVPLASVDLTAALRARTETETALAGARAEIAEATNRIAELEAEDARLAGVVQTQTARRLQAAEAINAAQAAVRQMAVATYIHGSPDEALAAVLDGSDVATEAVGQQVMLEEVSRDRAEALDDARRAHRRARQALDRATGARTYVAAELAAAHQRREAAAADEARLTDVLTDDHVRFEQTRATATVVGTDLPFVALDAYWRAQQALLADRPDCRVPWWAMAGLGRVESDHGRFADVTLEPDGETSAPILGIPLDGTRNTMRIEDTDDGRLDFDTEFDRAVGPMQFIPSTWRGHARDGDGDGVADPHNLYDAALSAAGYLCAGGPMEGEGHLRAGFLRYNHSQAYVERVLALAYGYAAVPGVPPLPPLVPAAPPPPIPSPG